ncbi:MAG: hypothetical protein IEMM0008_1825 [bacterium]|nr:MAG: hypothetical protein IEMM0008_1825 [bacterium]
MLKTKNTKEIKLEKSPRKRVSKELIYEMRYGKYIYYKNYDQVLSGEKTLEEIVGSSFLQAQLTAQLIYFLMTRLDLNKYVVTTNELGFKLAQSSWRSLDIAIFEQVKVKVKDYIDYDQYISIPPKLVIEIDTKADLRKFDNPQDYFHQKTKDLLDNNVEKVIWIFTKERFVWLAERGKDWLIKTWRSDIEVIDGIIINLEEFMKDLRGSNE